DLSVPQAKSTRAAAKAKTKSPEPQLDAPPDIEGEVIPAREIAAATSADVLGKSKDKEKSRDAKKEEPVAADKTGDEPKGTVVDEKTAVEQPPAVHIGSEPTPRPKPQPKKPKPIAVASTPLIG